MPTDQPTTTPDPQHGKTLLEHIDVFGLLEPLPSARRMAWFLARRWSRAAWTFWGAAAIYVGLPALLGASLVPGDPVGMVADRVSRLVPEPDSPAGCLGCFGLLLIGLATLGVVLVVGAVAFPPLVGLTLTATVPGAAAAQAWARDYLVIHALLWCCLLGIGFAMYLLRLHNRAVYACIELAVGLVVSWAALGAPDGSMHKSFATLAAAAYLLVRGMDNLLEAYREDQRSSPSGS